MKEFWDLKKGIRVKLMGQNLFMGRFKKEEDYTKVKE